ncbi:sugar kinase [Streptomyces sp. NPDC057445]|uniref:sugar kinase n=1 Tax=Streptomyces sp. NPDC057445 TaxID=3346136 RepID=UPI0036BFD264
MVTFVPSRPGRLADVPSFARTIGGAESNVACALAAAGHRVKWVSRVGADGFGDHLVAAVAAYGVDTTAVRRDPARPTGIYFRTATERTADAHEVLYFRAGSAASAMSPETVPAEDLAGARVLHLSGITAALSPGCLSLMRALTRRHPGRPLVSFDVNHRPGLAHHDPVVLLELARGADLVFVGEDEAEEAWGLRGPAAIRDALPEPDVLVVKQGARGATMYDRAAGARAREGARRPVREDVGRPVREDVRRPVREDVRRPVRDGVEGRGGDGAVPWARDGAVPCARDRAATAATAETTETVTFVPAPRVDVLAPVGAGDAFAAGFLSATLRGLDARTRLRHGHLGAAAALTVPGDLGVPPATAHADRLAVMDEDAWGTLHLRPGWTAAVRATEEVRTS